MIIGSYNPVRIQLKSRYAFYSENASNIAYQVFKQRDQIERFLQVLGKKLYHKSNPNMLMPFWSISDTVTTM